MKAAIKTQSLCSWLSTRAQLITSETLGCSIHVVVDKRMLAHNIYQIDFIRGTFNMVPCPHYLLTADSGSNCQIPETFCQLTVICQGGRAQLWANCTLFELPANLDDQQFCKSAAGALTSPNRTAFCRQAMQHNAGYCLIMSCFLYNVCFLLL